MNNSMAGDHPFQHLFETLGRVPIFHAESVNRQAYEFLSQILSVPVEKMGRNILLRAPRAGHGKTHLLSRVQHQLGASAEFIPLQAASGSEINAATVTDDALCHLLRQLPASGGLTALDLLTRRLFASALQPLVRSGEVPCQDREGALTALRLRPIETFDFHQPNAVTAHWARENFEILGQRLAIELAQRSGFSVSGISFWVGALFRFSAAPVDSPARVRVLVDEVHDAGGMEMERLEALLGLLTQLMRVVLVADELEGFHTHETAALRLAAFLGMLRQSVERLDVILSLNQDIWQSAFAPRLSGGLADRLSEVVVELESLSKEDMGALLDSRVPGLGYQMLQRLDVTAVGGHPRGLIRAAGLAWSNEPAVKSAQVLATPPSPVPIPSPESAPEVDLAVLVDAAAADLASMAEALETPPPSELTPQESAEDFSFQVLASDSSPVEVFSPFSLAVDEQETPDSVSQPVVESPPQTTANSLSPPSVGTDSAAVDTDRVDNLLRQFRNRYGRGAL